MKNIRQIKNAAKAITICALSAMFVGCASTGTYNAPKYYDTYSKAHNISSAGGIWAGMKDRHAPKGYNRLGEAAFASTDLYVTYFMNPSLGLTDWGSLGFGMLAKLTGPKKSGHRNNIFAWMPIDDLNITQEAAKQRFDSIINKAVLAAFDDLNIDHTYAGKGKFGQHVFKLNNDALDCSERTECTLEYRVKDISYKGASPSYTAAPSKSVVAFTAHGKYKDEYSWLEINSTYGSKFPQQDLYLAISRHLPAWAYIYLAANEVNTGEGKKITYPILLEKGKPELFIYPS